MAERTAPRNWAARVLVTGLVAMFILAISAASPPGTGTGSASALGTAPGLATATAVPAPAPVAPTGYQPVAPTRVMEARGRTPLDPAKPVDVVLGGVAGVPASGVGAVVLEVTAGDNDKITSVNVTAKGATAPAAQVTVVPVIGTTNQVIVPLGTAGKITVSSSVAKVAVAVDVVGWFPTADFTATAPTRIIDTVKAKAPLVSAKPVDVAVSGVGGVPASGVAAVVINVRGSNASTVTGVSVAPTGAAAPTSPQLPVFPLLGASTTVVVPMGTGGKLTFRASSGKLDVLADVIGWIPSSSNYTSITPTRVVDTVKAKSPLIVGKARDVVVTTGLPVVPTAVVLQLNGDPASLPSTVSVTPTGVKAARPVLDQFTLVPTGNQVIVPVNATGSLTFTTDGLSNFTADVVGYFAVPELPQPTDGSWRFDPSALTLTAAGQKATVRLVHIDASGAITPHLPPTTVTTALAGGAVATVTKQSRGVYEITANATIGEVLVTTSVPGSTTPFSAPLDVTNARIKPGVVTVSPSQVVFPFRDLPAGVDPVAAGLATATGIGPFTWAELAARAKLVSTDPNDPTSFINSDQIVPWIVNGVAPAAGTLLVMTGDRNFGKVVELPSAPTLARGGMSLIAVQAGSILDIYSELDNGLTDAQIALVTPTASAPAQLASAPQNLLSPQRLASEPNCNISGGIAIAAWNPQANVVPEGSFLRSQFQIRLTGWTARIRVREETRTTWGLTAGLNLSASGSMTCKLLEPPTPYIIPAGGPISAVAGLAVFPKITFEANLTVNGGPRLGFNYTCEQHQFYETGFVVDSRIGQLLPTIVHDTSADARLDAEPCPSLKDGSVTFSTDTNSISDPPVSVTGSVGLGLGVGFGLGPGVALGRVASYLFNDVSKGIELVEVKASVMAKVAWENKRNVLETLAGSSNAGVDLVFSASLKFAAIKKAISLLSGVEGQISGEFPIFSIPVSLASFYRTTNTPASVNITSDGSTMSSNGGTVIARKGSPVAVEIVADYLHAASPPLAGEAPITAATAYLKQGADFIEFPDLPLGVSGTRITGNLSVTPAVCTKLDPAGSVIAIVTNVPMGSVDTPGYAGHFTLKCEGDLSWSPASLSLTATKKTAPTPVKVIAKGLNNSTFTVTAVNPWVTVTPNSGTFTSNDEQVSLNVVGDCDAFPGSQTSGTTSLIVTTSASGVEGATMPVSLTCSDNYFQFQPNTMTGSGSANLVNRNADAVTFTVKADATWVTVDPKSGSFPAGPGTKAVSVSITARPAPQCGVALPERTAVVTATRSAGTPLQATLTVTDPALPARACGPQQNARMGGDPHLATFDGAYFDTQVVGEYVYFRPTDPAQTEPTLVARHELTNQAQLLVAAPTSVSAISYRNKGHNIEAYPGVPNKILIDGVQTTFADGVPVDVAAGLTVVTNGEYIAIVDDTTTISLRQWAIFFDVSVTVAGGSPIVGLLGSPDGNPANDIATASGTSITLDQARQHGTALYSVTDSWRLTDPATSPFTLKYAGFAEPNPIHDLSALQPYRQQVLSQLGPIQSICDVGSGWSSYRIDALALELAIGRTLSELPAYTCSYTVRGVARPAGSAEGVAGLRVTVDGPGLEKCTTTTTGVNGSYSCELHPSLAEVTATPATFPLPVTVIASWSDGGLPVSTTTASFATKSVADGPGVSATADLPLDASSVPTLNVSGTLLGNGGGLAGPVPVSVWGFDGSGNTVSVRTVSVEPDATTGAYSFSMNLLGTVISVSLTAQTGSFAEWTTKTVNGIVLGANAVTFDAAYRPTTLLISGVSTKRGVGDPKPFALRYKATGPNYSGETSIQVIPAADGSYSTSLTLSPRATSVQLTALVGTAADYQTITVDALAGGTRNVDFSFDVVPTGLTISGKLAWLGVPTNGQFTLSPFDAAGRALGTFTVPVQGGAPDGTYSVSVDLPSTAVRADLGIMYVRPGMQVALLSFGVNLTPGTQNTQTFSVNPVYLQLSGAITVNGTPVSQSDEVDLQAHEYNAAGGEIGGLGTRIRYDSSGRYFFETTLPADVASVKIVLNKGEAETTLTGFQIGLYPLTANFDLKPKGPAIDVSGTVRDQGVAVGGNQVQVNVRAFDVPDDPTADPPFTEVGSFFVDVDVADDGTYHVVVNAPAGADAVTIQALDMGGNAEQSGGLRLKPTGNAIQLDLDRSWRIFPFFGRATVCGASPYLPHVEVFSFTADPTTDYDQITRVWSGGTKIYDGLIAPFDDTGEYDLSVSVPQGVEFIGVRWSAEGSPSYQAGMFSQTRVIGFDANEPGFSIGQDLDLNCPNPTGGDLVVGGTVRDNGTPVAGGTVNLRITPYRITDVWAATPSFEAMSEMFVPDVFIDSLGNYQARVPLPPGASMAKVVADRNGSTFAGGRTVGVTASPTTLVLDVDVSMRTISMNGKALICGTHPYTPRLLVFAFAAPPTADLDEATGLWPGGVKVYDGIVTPDPVTGDYTLDFSVPADIGILGVDWSTSGSPMELPIGAGVRFAPEIPTGSDTGLGFDLNLNC